MKEQYIVDEHGRRTAVVLSLRDYERLIEISTTCESWLNDAKRHLLP